MDARNLRQRGRIAALMAEQFSEAALLIETAINALPDAQRIALLMRADGRRLEEIGSVLGISKERARQVVDLAARTCAEHLDRPRREAEALKQEVENLRRLVKARAAAFPPGTRPDLYAVSLFGDPFQWTTRIENALWRESLRTVGDLLRLGAEGVLKIRGLGAGSLHEIEQALQRLGLDLQAEGFYGTDAPEPAPPVA